MKRGDIRAITIEGRTRHLEYLGAGHYCKAWRDGEDVFLFVKGDYCKEPLLDIQGTKHIPKLERMESDTDDLLIYRMKYYPNVQAKDVKAWKEYRAIEAALESAREAVRKRYPSKPLYVFGHDINYRTATNPRISPSMQKALQELANASCNWGSSITFEFAPRNLGVDNKGNLILRDILFDAEKIFQEYTKRWRSQGRQIT